MAGIRMAKQAAVKDLEKYVERVTEALAQTSPLNTVGIHAVIERTAPGVVSKHTVAAEVSGMLSKGLLVRAGTTARGASFALANGGTH